jgi:hypothetical protein
MTALNNATSISRTGAKGDVAPTTTIRQVQTDAVSIEKSFLDECRNNNDPNEILSKLDHYMDAANCLEDEYWKKQSSDGNDQRRKS